MTRATFWTGFLLSSMAGALIGTRDGILGPPCGWAAGGALWMLAAIASNNIRRKR